MKLLVVESPNKVPTIKKYLDQLEAGRWNVVATAGHWRGLPSMRDRVFADVVDLTTWKESFVLQKDDVARKLSAAISHADEGVFLATDPDREGEAIAWHVVDHFRLRGARRVRFTEITKKAIAAAIAAPTELDTNLVEAQRTRSLLDYEFGMEGSRQLWRFGCQSAGRVQSAGLRILVDRENAIRNFKPVDFWTVSADYAEGFSADVASFEEATEEERDDEGEAAEGKLRPTRYATKAAADADVLAARGVAHIVESVERKPANRRPPAPYTTSSLQADASTRLKWDPAKTAEVAQQLFEDGLVSYIRTDSTSLSDDAVAAIRAYIGKHHPTLLPTAPQVYADKNGAQAAHEAIRPTALEDERADALTGNKRELYALIHARTVACQTADAQIERTTIVVAPKGLPWRLRAVGSVTRSPGFLALKTVPPGTISEDGALPPVEVGQVLHLEDIGTEAGRTKPLSRFTAASLIRYLERVRIGRPSTYASTVTTLLDRDYVEKKKQNLVPTEHGELADRLLRTGFDVLTQEEFTAKTEKALDKISEGKVRRVDFLAAFHKSLLGMLATAVPALADYAAKHPDVDRDAVIVHETPCPVCGAQRLKRKGRNGSYAQCSSDACGKRENLEPLKEVEDPCPTCAATVVEQPYQKEGKKVVFYRCSSCSWKSTYKPPRPTLWPCHNDVAHGCMVEITYKKAGESKAKKMLKCPVCELIAWTGPKPPACPKCSTPAMRALEGPNGPFWGCSVFKESGCKGVLPFELPPAPRKKATRKKASK